MQLACRHDSLDGCWPLHTAAPPPAPAACGRSPIAGHCRATLLLSAVRHLPSLAAAAAAAAAATAAASAAASAAATAAGSVRRDPG